MSIIKKSISVVLSLLLILGSCLIVAVAKENETVAETLIGVPNGYIAIYTKDDLDNIRNNLRGHYILMNDIVFDDSDFVESGEYWNEGNLWLPIGHDSYSKFSGVLDGNGFSIINLRMNVKTVEYGYFGLFSSCAGIIKNLSIKNADITVSGKESSIFVGGFAGELFAYSDSENSGLIENCFFEGNITATSDNYFTDVGGIVGTASTDTQIIDCHNYGTIKSQLDAGGIVSENHGLVSKCSNNGEIILLNSDSVYTSGSGGICARNNNTIEYCYNVGNITSYANYGYDGGIAGENRALLTDCYNTGTISGSSVGGIIGDSAYGTTQQCYNVGTLEGSTHEGGIVAFVFWGTVDNCYYLQGNTGLGDSISDYDLQTQAPLSYLDFEDIWEFVEGNVYKYPTLKNNSQYVFADEEYQGGLGTEENPYLIASTNQLYNVRDNLTANFKLVRNIVFTPKDFSEEGSYYNNGKGWEPIGTSETSVFSGIFDGNGFSISGLEINIVTTEIASVGLFGYCSGSIKNLTIEDSNYKLVVDGKDYGRFYAGGIVGYQNGGEIINCISSVNVSAKTSNDYYNYYPYAGGIVGFVYDANIQLCENEGNICVSPVSSSQGGGIAGGSDRYVTIINCLNKGMVDGGENAGGIVGNAHDTELIKNCANIGSVVGSLRAGGICGYSWYEFSIQCCYNTGNVLAASTVTTNSTEAHAYAGGIVGESHSGTIMNCFNSGIVEATTVRLSAHGGGIAGRTSSDIYYCYNVGLINSTDYATGICGSSDSMNGGSLNNCYYLDNCERGFYGGICNEITKCSEEQMKDFTTYAYFDFNNIWTMLGREDYPYPELVGVPFVLPENFHKHSYSSNVTAPTCTENGYTTYTCECGDTYVADYVDATGHSHTAEVTTPATHKATGVMTYTCHCGDTYTETIDKIAEHNHTAVVTAPTCEDQGYTTYTCVCGDSYVADYVDAKGHTAGEWVVTKPATSTQSGTKTQSCTVCGSVLNTQTIPAYGKVNSVSVSNVSLVYKSSTTLNPQISADAGVKYTVSYSSSNPSVASVDANGKITTKDTGSATITVTVTDEFGNTVSDTCNVEVKYNWWQWIIVIVLFGWIWY